MKKRFTTLFAFVLAALMFVNISPVQAQTGVDNEPALTIVSGFKGGSYYTMAMDMQEMTNDLGTPITRDSLITVSSVDEFGDTITTDSVIKVKTGEFHPFLEVKDSDGSYYNFLKIEKSDIDLTFLQYDVLLSEDEKDLQRRLKKVENIRILFPIGTEHIHIITLKDSKIEEFADLKKKRVGIGSSLQGTNVTATYIKKITESKWEDVEIPYDRSFKALFKGDIDAFFFVGRAPVGDLESLSKAMKDKIKLIPLDIKDADQKKKLEEAYGAPVQIKNSDYSWVDKDITTYQVKTVLVTSKRGENEEKLENLQLFLDAIKAKKSQYEEKHAIWKNVVFEKDESIEFEYHELIK